MPLTSKVDRSRAGHDGLSVYRRAARPAWEPTSISRYVASDASGKVPDAHTEEVTLCLNVFWKTDHRTFEMYYAKR